MNIIAIVGSNADSSTNRNLLNYMRQHYEDQVTITLMEIHDFPIFNKPDSPLLPELVSHKSALIEEADGVLISTPEYDHAVPAALMNALNWLSFHNYPFVDKPVMIVGASYGTLGSSRAQLHLKQIMDSPELKPRIMPSSEYHLSHSLNAFDDNGNLKDMAQAKQLDGLFKDFLSFITISKQLNHAHALNKKEAENFSWDEPEATL